jgi:hypothetical protein
MDQGRTWHLAAVATADQAAFKFHAPQDGEYWFTVSVVDRQGIREIADISPPPVPGLKVRVQTTGDVPENGKKAPAKTDDKTVRVGHIRVVGNDATRQDVIRKAVSIFPGQVLTYQELRAAERTLEQLNLFEVNPKTGVRPTVTVVDSDNDDLFKDILIQVKEKKASKH